MAGSDRVGMRNEGFVRAGTSALCIVEWRLTIKIRTNWRNSSSSSRSSRPRYFAGEDAQTLSPLQCWDLDEVRRVRGAGLMA